MGQEILWFLHEMRDVGLDLWQTAPELFILGFAALIAAAYFSLRRS